MSETEFALEEYKLTRQRINENEKVRFQMLVLNVTAFAAIFGFSSLIPQPVVPFVLLGVLLVCGLHWMGYVRVEMFATAFLVERYGSYLDCASLEAGYVSLVNSERAQSKSLVRKLRAVLAVCLHPYSILSYVSLGAAALFSYQFWLSNWTAGRWYVTVAHGLAAGMGHLPLLHRIVQNQVREGHEYFRKWWRNYLDSQEPDE